MKSGTQQFKQYLPERHQFMSNTQVFLHFIINFPLSERTKAWFCKLAEKKTNPELTAHSNLILNHQRDTQAQQSTVLFPPLQSFWFEEQFTLWAAAWSWDPALHGSRQSCIPSSWTSYMIEVEDRCLSTSLNQILRISLPLAKEVYLLAKTKEILTQRKLMRAIYCSRIYYRS